MEVPPTPEPTFTPAEAATETPTEPIWEPILIGQPRCESWIVYHTNREGIWQIFRAGDVPDAPDAPLNLSRGHGESPSLSPDRRWVAFVSSRDGNGEVYLAAVDHDDVRRITTTDTSERATAWSPSGRYVAYEAYRGVNGDADIYVLDVTTGSESVVVSSPSHDRSPSWSADERTLIFESDRDSFSQIYAIDLETRAERRLSDGSGVDDQPVVSPDGSWIVFRSLRGGNSNHMIHIMRADGTQITPISDAQGDTDRAVWSPDSQLIAYQSTLVGNLDVLVYELSTAQTRILTLNSTEESAPTWICNTDTVVFTSLVTGNADIFSTTALPIDAPPVDVLQSAQQLTDDLAEDRYPGNAFGQPDIFESR